MNETINVTALRPGVKPDANGGRAAAAFPTEQIRRPIRDVINSERRPIAANATTANGSPSHVSESLWYSSSARGRTELAA